MGSTNGPQAAGIDFTDGRGAAALRRFAGGMQRRVFGGRVLGALLRTALAVAVPALLLAWWLPWLRPMLLLSVGAVMTPVLLVTVVRAHLARRRVLLALARRLSASPAAAAVHDELLTWLEFDGRRAALAAAPPPALLDWLERDVAARLSREQRRELAVASRPSLGRFVWLLPLVLALLLAWLLAEWLAPPWPGVLGGGAPQSAAGGGSGDGGTGDGGSSAGAGGRDDPQAQERDSTPPQDQEAAPQPQDPPAPESPEPDTADEPPATPPVEPAPLLDLPEQQHFVVPEFIDDGPTRRARMHAAEIEAGGAQAPPPVLQTPRGGDAEPQPEAPLAPEQRFERAAEQALRSRHVPDAERDIVRRYFDLLQQKGR